MACNRIECRDFKERLRAANIEAKRLYNLGSVVKAHVHYNLDENNVYQHLFTELKKQGETIAVSKDGGYIMHLNPSFEVPENNALDSFDGFKYLISDGKVVAKIEIVDGEVSSFYLFRGE